MAPVVFSFGSHPTLDEHDALELAGLLSRTRNLAAVRAADKMRERARCHPRDETEDVALDEPEMIELYVLLGTPSATAISEAMGVVYRELAAALGAV